MAVPQKPAAYAGMLEHVGEEQGTDSQVSEMGGKLLGKYAATKSVTELTE